MAVVGRRTCRRSVLGARTWPRLLEKNMLPILFSTFSLLPSTARPLAVRSHLAVTRHMAVAMGRKPGVSEPAALKDFVANAGDKVIVVDARNTDFAAEPGDEATNAKAPIGGGDVSEAS